MVTSIFRHLIDRILGPAARAGQQLLDAEARLSYPPRALAGLRGD